MSVQAQSTLPNYDSEPSMVEATLAATGWLLSRGLFAALFVLMFAPVGG